MVQPLWKTERQFLQKLKVELSCDLAVSYTKESKTGTQGDMCTFMFIHHSSNCVSSAGWMSKRNVVYTCSGIWMNLEDMMLSRTSWSQKDRHCVILLLWNPIGPLPPIHGFSSPWSTAVLMLVTLLLPVDSQTAYSSPRLCHFPESFTSRLLIT